VYAKSTGGNLLSGLSLQRVEHMYSVIALSHPTYDDFAAVIAWRDSL
jgi:hypothetical protein